MKGYRRSKWLKPLRVILAFGLVLPLILVFVAGAGSPLAAGTGLILFFQFIPSVISFLTAAGILSAGWIIILAFTFLSGRLYCSTACPLGFVMDVVICIRRWITGQGYSLSTHGDKGTWLHYTVTAAAWILFASGSLLLVSLLDPFTLAANLFGLPGHMSDGSQRITAFMVASMTGLVLIVIVTWCAGRWYCNHLCPAGGVFRLISSKSLFRIAISSATCSGCGECKLVCKADCIDPENRTLDFTRCVMCFDCIQVCRDGAIGIGFRRDQQFEEKGVMAIKEGGRRRFLKGIAAGAGMALIAPAFRYYGEKVPDRSPVMPPGAQDLYHFSDRCTACHLCVQRCPTEVLQPGLLDYGLTGIFQPKMDFTSGFCLAGCTVCGEICPTGAIFALEKEERNIVQTGIARYVKNLCVVVAEEKACSICAEQCPAGAIRMVDRLQNKIPEISERYCTGCGACEYACPARPERAIYIESNRFHRVALIKQAL